MVSAMSTIDIYSFYSTQTRCKTILLGFQTLKRAFKITPTKMILFQSSSIVFYAKTDMTFSMNTSAIFLSQQSLVKQKDKMSQWHIVSQGKEP